MRWHTCPRVLKGNLLIFGLEKSHEIQKIERKSLISLLASVSVLPRHLQYLPDLLTYHSYKSSLDLVLSGVFACLIPPAVLGE